MRYSLDPKVWPQSNAATGFAASGGMLACGPNYTPKEEPTK